MELILMMLCLVKEPFGVKILSSHVPSTLGEQLKVVLVQLTLTLTVVFVDDLPHNFTTLFCCKTMLSLNKSGIFTVARRGV